MSNIKLFFRHFFIFYIKVALIHTLTYFIFGLLFSNIFDYSTIYSYNVVNNFMRNFDSPLILLGPFLQPIRAIFIAIALYPIRNIIATKLGFLKLWIILVFIGIIAAPAASPSSLEGIIYTQLPIEYHLMSLPELLLQTLTFSLLLWAFELLPHKDKDFSNRIFLLKIIFSIFFSLFGIFLTSVSGLIIINFLEIDYMNIKLDKETISYLTAILILTIIVSYGFANKVAKNKIWLLLIIPLIFVIYLVLPYFYNYFFNTAYNTKIALIPYASSSVLMSFIYYVIFALFYGRIVKNKNIENTNKTIPKNNDLEIENIESNDKNSEDINNTSLDNENKEDSNSN